jgi:hypothetical protein
VEAHDLYEAPDAATLKADLAQSEQAADAMQARYAGKLAALLDGGKGGAELARAVREFEALNDIMGRIVSYASLLYAADTSDPKRQKFFGDIQEDHRHLFEAPVLPARAQPARRRDAGDGDVPFRARPLPALARGSAEREALSARRQARAVVP